MAEIIRPGRPDDLPVVERIVRSAYEVYLPRIGKPPGPMLDDYRRLLAEGSVSVAEVLPGVVAGLLVLLDQEDHLLLDNVAVGPGHQGHGLGRRLIAFAEAEARRRGFAEVRLYTHAMMTENIGLYRRLGYQETGRGLHNGYDRVFFSKRLDA